MRSCRGNGEQALVSPAGANRDNERVLKGEQGSEGGDADLHLSQHPLLLPSLSALIPPFLLSTTSFFPALSLPVRLMLPHVPFLSFILFYFFPF